MALMGFRRFGGFSCYNEVMAKRHTKHKWKMWPALVGLWIVATIGMGASVFYTIQGEAEADYVVETNAFFAPFEFYDNRQIVGVDVEIVQRVAERLNKTIQIKNVEFDVIIDNVEAGRIADAGAAGLTITPAREEKVNFTIPYYDSVQYVIFPRGAAPALRGDHIVWEALAGAQIGSQVGSIGYMFVEDEIDNGVLANTGTTVKGIDSHQLAADAVTAHIVDYAIADELAARYIVSKNPALEALPLYYAGPTREEDYPVEESYAIAVNKERTELLTAFNEVLGEMLTADASGETEIDRLVLKYMGLLEEQE